MHSNILTIFLENNPSFLPLSSTLVSLSPMALEGAYTELIRTETAITIANALQADNVDAFGRLKVGDYHSLSMFCLDGVAVVAVVALDGSCVEERRIQTCIVCMSYYKHMMRGVVLSLSSSSHARNVS